MDNKNLQRTIESHLPQVQQEVERFVTLNKCDYETFGKQVEDPAADILVKLLHQKGLIKSSRRATHKNEFPDLRVVEQWNGTPIAIDVKASNHSGMKAGLWAKNTSPANDLGTFKTLPEHVAEWGGENIYFLWVHYNFTDVKQEIVKVEFAPFYRFVGMNPEGLLKYRISDGKIRPRTYLQEPFFENFKEFKKVLERTDCHRSEKIILREYSALPLAHRRRIMESLSELNQEVA